MVDERLLMHVPKGMPLLTVRGFEVFARGALQLTPSVQAGGLPEVWLTAYQLLHLVGGLRAGDVVLVHAAGSGVGTAAIQVCGWRHARRAGGRGAGEVRTWGMADVPTAAGSRGWGDRGGHCRA